jgi:tRNA threonylcarbamoyladenosine biosynthesis protein TsaB
MAESAAAIGILGFDTSTSLTAVAVTSGSRVAFECGLEADPAGRPRHATELLARIDEGVRAAGGWDRIEAIAVGIGPGSFTGLRIGVATARALGQALGKPLVPVSSLAALGRGIGKHPSGGGRLRLAAIDARRREVFAALYDEHGAVAWEPFVAGPPILAERVAELEAAPLAAGDGSLRFRQELEAAGAEVPGGDDPVHRLSARHICRLAEGEAPVRPESVKPMYLRRPDAEVWRERVRDRGTHRA